MPYLVIFAGAMMLTGDATRWPGTALICAAMIALAIVEAVERFDRRCDDD